MATTPENEYYSWVEIFVDSNNTVAAVSNNKKDVTFRELCCLLEHILSKHLTSIDQTNLNSASKAGKNMVEFRFALFHESNNNLNSTHLSVDIERNRMFNELFLWYYCKLSDMMSR